MDALLAGLGADAPAGAAAADLSDEPSDNPGTAFSNGTGSESDIDAIHSVSDQSSGGASSDESDADSQAGSSSGSEVCQSDGEALSADGSGLADAQHASQGGKQVASSQPERTLIKRQTQPAQPRSGADNNAIVRSKQASQDPAIVPLANGTESSSEGALASDDEPSELVVSEQTKTGSAAASHDAASAKQQATSVAKYLPPAKRQRAAPGAVGAAPESASMKKGLLEGPAEQPELLAVRRRIRSLLNRVASANLGGIAQQLAAVFMQAPRHLVIDTIVSSVMQVRPP